MLSKEQKEIKKLFHRIEDGHERTQVAVDIIINCITDMCFDADQFIKLLALRHRTLQQRFTHLCLQWFWYLSLLKENEYDPRNEASVKVAKEICKNKEKWDFYLPII